MTVPPDTNRTGRRPPHGRGETDLKVPTCYADGYARARERAPRLAELYVRHTRVGDPLADAVVEELAAGVNPERVHQVLARALDSPAAGDAPQSVRELLASVQAVPDWFDPQVAMAGTRAFLRNSSVVMMGLVCGAIIEGFSTLIAKSFHIRGRIRDNGVRRLKQNMLHLLEQFMPGGIQPGGDGWRLSLRIRLVHAQSRRLLRNSGEWDFAAHGMPLSAAHMMLGAAAFSARLMRHVSRLGGDFSDEEREAYVHVWRYTSVLLGVPEPIRFTDQASALHAFAIGAMCEPTFDDDSIIMANSIINSAPILPGQATPGARRSLAATLYQISRSLIGQESADRLRFPPRTRGVSPLRLLRWKNHLVRLLRRGLRSRGSLTEFLQLLYVSDLQKYDNDYRLPTSLYDEESSEW